MEYCITTTMDDNIYSYYHWCVVPGCKNTSIKTPDKFWIELPNDEDMKNIWLNLARRDAKLLPSGTQLYFCEDHFDLQNDLENFEQYKIMNPIKIIKVKTDCVPSKFECQVNRQKKLHEHQPALKTRRRWSIIEEIKPDPSPPAAPKQEIENKITTSTSAALLKQDLQQQADLDRCTYTLPYHGNPAIKITRTYQDEGVQASLHHEHRASQASRRSPKPKLMPYVKYVKRIRSTSKV